MRKLNFFLSIFVFCLLAVQPLSADDIVVTTEFGGFERTFRVHVPASYDGSLPVPLVFVLHDFGGSGLDIQALTGIDYLSEERGFIAVFPDSLTIGWNYADQPQINDVGFIGALINAYEERFNIDSSRIFVVGYANGGVMAYRAACDLSDQIRGAMIVSATMPVSLAESCTPSNPVSLMLIQGTLDTVFPWNDRPDTANQLRKRFLMSVPETVAFWRDHNACSDDPVATQEPDLVPEDNTLTWREDYPACAEDRLMVLYRVEGGGHYWPGSSFGMGASLDFSATGLIGDFIAAHPSQTQPD
jgi:polyhydroxybutyrate depolymerase